MAEDGQQEGQQVVQGVSGSAVSLLYSDWPDFHWPGAGSLLEVP